MSNNTSSAEAIRVLRKHARSGKWWILLGGDEKASRFLLRLIDRFWPDDEPNSKDFMYMNIVLVEWDTQKVLIPAFLVKRNRMTGGELRMAFLDDGYEGMGSASILEHYDAICIDDTAETIRRLSGWVNKHVIEPVRAERADKAFIEALREPVFAALCAQLDDEPMDGTPNDVIRRTRLVQTVLDVVIATTKGKKYERRKRRKPTRDARPAREDNGEAQESGVS